MDNHTSEPPLKKCRDCGLKKQLSEFCKLSRSKDGLHPACKSCKNAYQRHNYKHGASEEIVNRKAEQSELFAQGLCRCSNCKTVKPATIEYFRPYPGNTINGLKSWCRQCETAWGVEYIRQHPEIGKAKSDRYRLKNREQRNAHFRNWYWMNAEAQRQRARDYILRNPEKVKVTWAKYKSNNRAKVAVSNARWRKYLRNADGEYNENDVLDLYDEQDGLCAYCGIRVFLTLPKDCHVDHILPLSRGGSNYPDNLCLTCSSCNTSKGAKLPEEWIASRNW